MKERRERVMGDFVTDAATEYDPLDAVIRERFNAERHPELSVDGTDRWNLDLFEEDPDDA